VCSLVSVVFCRVEVSDGLITCPEESHRECGESECGREASIVRRALADWGAFALLKKKQHNKLVSFGIMAANLYRLQIQPLMNKMLTSMKRRWEDYFE